LTSGLRSEFVGMKLDELSRLFSSTDWFSRIGEPDYEGRTGFVALPNLEEWRSVTEMLANEPEPFILKQGMDWLPSSLNEADPIYGRTLEEEAERLGSNAEFTKQILHIYKTGLVALRRFDGHPLLRVGPNDFTNAAREVPCIRAVVRRWKCCWNDLDFGATSCTFITTDIGQWVECPMAMS
jgi:hypothetical protein